MKKWVRTEVNIKILACFYIVSMIFVYGTELFLCGIKSISYPIIIQMMIVGYLIAWCQRILFLKEKIYSKIEFIIRAILWNTIPMILTVLAAVGFQWFQETEPWLMFLFFIVMMWYYVVVWIILQVFYKNDTDALNKMLFDYQYHKKTEELK